MDRNRKLTSLVKPDHVYKVRIKIYANMLDMVTDDFESMEPASELFYSTADNYQLSCTYYEKYVWVTFSFVTVQAKNIFIKNFYNLTWKKDPEIQDLS